MYVALPWPHPLSRLTGYLRVVPPPGLIRVGGSLVGEGLGMQMVMRGGMVNGGRCVVIYNRGNRSSWRITGRGPGGFGTNGAWH